MRVIDAMLEMISEITENHDQVPSTWTQNVGTYTENGMNLTLTDIALIVEVLNRCSPCRLLEIGAGTSTKRLFAANPSGLNISLEDNPDWIEKVSAELPPGEGILLRYHNRTIQSTTSLPVRNDWRAKIKRTFGTSLDQLRIEDMRLLQKRVVIPDWLWTIEFDVVVVDGPYGAEWNSPGRSGTQFLASRLAGPGSVVFVDDANRLLEMRQIEQFMGDRYLYSTPSRKMIVAI